MASQDSRGLPLSTTSDSAAAHYRQGVDLMLAAWPGAAEALDAAIHDDPEFALAHAARARLHAISAETPQARAVIASAEGLVAQRGSERERSHVSVLALAINGQAAKALKSALAHIDAWPTDLLIFSLPLGAFGLFAFSGMAGHDQARVDLCERHANHFGPDDAWFLTNAGWAYAENGAVGRGRDLLERSFALKGRDANTVHALAHAMFEAGEGETVKTLIAGWLPTYDRSGILHGHLAWHSALVNLIAGDAGGALSLYDEHVRPSVSAGLAITVVSDSASLLWRAQAYGHSLPEGSWAPVAAFAAKAFPKPGLAFIDVHMALLEAATGDRAAIERRIAALANMTQAGFAGAGPVTPAICNAALAFADGDYQQCVQILEPVAAEVVRIGGSGAQREIIEDTLIVAQMRSGEAAKARERLERRLHRRPSPRDTRWLSELPA
jgi:Tfp pilus assembly protein PilF